MLAADRPIRNTRAVHFGASWRWSVSLISAFLLIAVGIVACFFGKRLYRVVLALIGFVIGFHAAAELLGSQPDRARIAGILFGLGMGLALVLAVAGAVLGWRLADFILRLSTAFGGALQVVAGAGALAAVLGLNLPLLDVTKHATVAATSTAGIVSLLAAGLPGAFGYAYQSQQDAQRAAK